MKDLESVITNLRRNGFRVTPQRLAVIEFLVGNKAHPTAEAIYDELKKRYPMMSFSTIYNTIKALQRIGEIIHLSSADEPAHFDPDTSPHHHFYCLECRQLKDIFRDLDIPRDQINGHRVQFWRVYFYGTCSDCLKKQPREVLS